jgi:hypothetical protein
MTNPLLCLDVKDMGENAEIPAPNICVLLLTYLRTSMAVETVKYLCERLDYPKELLSFYVADDGSPPGHMQAIFDEIRQGGVALAGYHNEKYAPAPYVGTGWNRGLMKAYQTAPIVLQLEDDWRLKANLDIRPYVRCLVERTDVGMIRLSGLPVGLEMRVEGYRGVHYLNCLRSAAFAYSGNPHLRNFRFTQCYGAFATNQTPGNLEIEYDRAFRENPRGPSIWRPADLPAWGIFDHIGNERTW